jgi:serine/threonine-protein kinase
MGEVYRATDLLLGQSVALKFLPDALSGSQAALERLRTEVRLARQISHPNVCRVYDIGETGAQMFLTMEYIDGEDLASLLRRIGRLPSAKALEIARRLCAALAAAHEKGVIHRDLKPGNVMIDGRGQVLITDFGLAGTAGEISRSDVQSGTPAYMAPEQLAGEEVTRRSDLYALGLLLFELFAGEPPYPAAADREQLKKLRQAQPRALADLVADIDPALDRLVARCLDPIPANRPQSALSVAAALPGGDPLAAALAMGETPSPDLVAAAEPAETMRPRIAAVCLSALLISTLLGAWIAGATSMLAPVAADLEPGAMAQTARDILARFGYPGRPPWTAWGLEFDYATLNTLTRLGRSVIRERVAQDPPWYFWYRASPNAMVGSNPFQPFATHRDPPLAEPGMTRVRLNADRRLQSLTVIPPALSTAAEPSTMFDWKGLFDAAGLDPAQFEPAAPVWTPPAAFDARAAWLQKSSADPLRIEAAAWRGRPVFFESARNSKAVKPAAQPTPDLYVPYVITLLTLISVLAWYNVRRGRGDLRGTARFALFIMAAASIRILLMAPHPGGYPGFNIFVAIVGNTLWAGATSAVGYVALEPLVRKRWPRALIAWTRLLNGRFRDPVVVHHLLAGLLCGAAVALAARLLIVVEFGVGATGWSYLLSSSASRTVQGILSGLIEAASETPWLFCLLFVTSTVLRNKWLGASVTGAILSASFLWGSNSPVLGLITVPLLVFGVMLFALRYGLFALVAAMFTFHLLSSFPMTLDSSAFYFNASLATLVTVNGLGAYAYSNLIAAQPRATPRKVQ